MDELDWISTAAQYDVWAAFDAIPIWAYPIIYIVMLGTSGCWSARFSKKRPAEMSRHDWACHHVRSFLLLPFVPFYWAYWILRLTVQLITWPVRHLMKLRRESRVRCEELIRYFKATVLATESKTIFKGTGPEHYDDIDEADPEKVCPKCGSVAVNVILPGHDKEHIRCGVCRTRWYVAGGVKPVIVPEDYAVAERAEAIKAAKLGTESGRFDSTKPNLSNRQRDPRMDPIAGDTLEQEGRVRTVTGVELDGTVHYIFPYPPSGTVKHGTKPLHLWRAINEQATIICRGDAPPLDYAEQDVKRTVEVTENLRRRIATPIFDGVCPKCGETQRLAVFASCGTGKMACSCNACGHQWGDHVSKPGAPYAGSKPDPEQQPVTLGAMRGIIAGLLEMLKRKGG